MLEKTAHVVAKAESEGEYAGVLPIQGVRDEEASQRQCQKGHDDEQPSGNRSLVGLKQGFTRWLPSV